MATGAFPTLLDVANRQDASGNIPVIAEMLSQKNDIYQDLPMIEANERTSHLFVMRNSIPAGSWRSYNVGIPGSKSTTFKGRVGLAMLYGLSQVDRDLARHTGNVERFRRSEDVAFLEGMGQTITQTIFYGNNVTNPSTFMGFATFYNTINTANSQNAANVLNAGGTGSSNTSLWLFGWGPNKMYAVYPVGTKVGLEMEDRGDSWQALDSAGNPFPAYTGIFSQEMAVVPQDWRYGARLCNIDVTTAGLAGANAPDLFALMAQMQFFFPQYSATTSGITDTDAPDGDGAMRPVWYGNRTTLHWMQVQAMRNRNVLATINDYAGRVINTWRGTPIKCVDQITNTEAALT